MRYLLGVDFGGSYIHTIAGFETRPLDDLYTKALENGGEYFKRAKFPGFGSGKRADLPQDEDGKTVSRRFTVRDRLVYVSVTNVDGKTLTVMLDTAETPVYMIKGALMLQLLMVTAVMLFAACPPSWMFAPCKASNCSAVMFSAGKTS